MFKGRALLVIDKLDSEHVPWGIQPFVQAMNHEDPGGEVHEMFSCAAADCAPMPAAAHRMKTGDRIRVLVHFEIHFSRSWEGEHDADLYLERVRVLRRQPYVDRVFRKRHYRFWREDQRRHG